jgi:hypothetical protein
MLKNLLRTHLCAAEDFQWVRQQAAEMGFNFEGFQETFDPLVYGTFVFRDHRGKTINVMMPTIDAVNLTKDRFLEIMQAHLAPQQPDKPKVRAVKEQRLELEATLRKAADAIHDIVGGTE